MNLIDVTKQFATTDKCLDYLEALRWPDGVRCPVCGNDKLSRIARKKASKNKRTRLYQCLEPTCKHQFSPTAGTIFHDSHLDLREWFMAVALMLNAKKGLSALQLQRDLGIGSYRTAWYLAHRIRKAMEDGDGLKHQRIRHSRGEYVRGEVHTNTIENAFSLLKRAVIGTYHQLSIKHLQR